MDKDKKILDDFMAIKYEQDAQTWADHMRKLCDTLQEEKRMLDAKILTFRQLLHKASGGEEPVALTQQILEAGKWLDKYDQHFGIQIHRHGTTE